VPGDPDEVNRQAAHLASVARQITSQVAALRAIAADADGSLTGAYATKIHAAAGDTGGQLAQVAGRYEKASTALRAWAPDLEYTQALSLRALNQAEAPYLTLKNLVPPQSAGGPLTAAQEQDQQAYKRVAGRAQFALDAARALLARAVSVRDEAAARCAAAIRAASDDAIADYWVFGGAAPISRQAGTLLEQAAAGSTRALAALLAIQRGGRPGLAQAVAAWWQITRATDGNGLSYLYAVEWPVFAILGVYFWWMLIHTDYDTVGLKGMRNRESSEAAVPPTAVAHAPVTPVTPLPVTLPSAAPADEEDPELAAYNARLASLSARGPQTWRHREHTVVRRGPTS